MVVLAGCSAFTNGDGGSSEGARDASTGVTPAPVPTVEGTATPGPRVAPGLTATRVTNASALAAAHEGVLENTSVTIRRVTTYRYGSGAIARRETVTTRIGPDSRRLRIVERRGAVSEGGEAGETGETTTGTNGEGIVQEGYWFGANRSARALTHANGTTTYGTNPPKNLTRSRRTIIGTEATRLRALASGFETRVRPAGNESDGRYRVASTGVKSGPGLTERVGFVPVSSFRLVVDSGGFVEEYRLVRRLSVGRRGKPTEIVTRVRYTDVGETTVERPPWYDDATNASASVGPEPRRHHGRV